MEPFELVTELEHIEQVTELEHIRRAVDILVAVGITELVVLMAHSSSLEEQIHNALVET